MWRTVVLVTLALLTAPTPPALQNSVETSATVPCGTNIQPVSPAVVDTAHSRLYLSWEKKIPKDSKLCALKLALETQADVLPASDQEDRSALPTWFRVLLRKQDTTSQLPTSGPRQYPRNANFVLQKLIGNPNGSEADHLLKTFKS